MKRIIASILFVLLTRAAFAAAPSEDFLKANLAGTWLLEVTEANVKFIATTSYSSEGTVEYRMRQAGANEDLARWSSRYTVNRNCVEDVVIATSNEDFSAIGEEDQECVLETQLQGRRMQWQSAEGEKHWMFKINDHPGDERCLKPLRPPLCKRAAFLLSPTTIEAADGHFHFRSQGLR